MPLAAYLPLEAVYAFHEAAETWILRRYSPAVAEAAGAERTRADFAEQPIALFRDRTATSTTVGDGGQDGPGTCTAYTRTRLLTTDDDAPQPADVLFDPLTGEAWQATRRGDWDEARGFAVTLTRAGRRGQVPWV